MLTARQAEALKLLISGERSARAANLMNVSENTFKFHVRNAREAMGARTTIQAAVAAVSQGLIE